ncbi:MAG: UDP-N-acetylmuramoyl-L-alanine--D-glutamate ligase [Planctomycetes bacterium]|nr:UDP-N-acetylmuramoyl-L-alanine--D-glutamate ligase [Planctomycetota bacterium]
MSTQTGAHTTLHGKRVTVMGLGLFGGGLEVTRHLVARGARVTVTDLRPREKLAESLALLGDTPVELVLGEHRDRDFTGADLVIANPAVAPSNEFLVAARRAGVPISSELVLFLEATRARVVLVTGTQGKSSTANATAGLLDRSGFTVELGGNIGRSLLSTLDELGPEAVAVVEISSYQLEALPERMRATPCVAALCCTNVLADHLERHGTLDAYEAAKKRILEFADERSVCVLNGEDPRVGAWRVDSGATGVGATGVGAPRRGATWRYFATRGGADDLRIADGEFRRGREVLGRVADLRLPGTYQRENVLAALGLARALGAAPERLAAAIHELVGLEHREQDLGVFGARRVWDNGVSTTPDSTVAALRSLDRPWVVLIGGQMKNLPLDELVLECRARRLRVVLFGGSRAALAPAFERGVVEHDVATTVEDAVRLAWRLAQADDEILFSPACASFDAYRNFKDRAAAFRAALPARDEARA